jgi:hypothetical protein
VLHESAATLAPFQVSYELPNGAREGLIAYAFRATSVCTKNRPATEHRFQIKYGSKDGQLHELWQDPFRLYTTLFFGINVEQQFFVAADPALNSPTRFFISKEFDEKHARSILNRGWHFWTRPRQLQADKEPVEVLVGGTKRSFLHYVHFERAALRASQLRRAVLAKAVTQAPDSEQS